MIVENGMVIGAQTEYDNACLKAERRLEDIQIARDYFRKRWTLEDTKQSLLDAPNQLQDYLEQNIREYDWDGSVATIMDIIEYAIDQKALREVDND